MPSTLSSDVATQIGTIHAAFRQQIIDLRDQLNALRDQERDAILTVLHPERAAAITAAAIRREEINARISTTRLTPH